MKEIDILSARIQSYWKCPQTSPVYGLSQVKSSLLAWERSDGDHNQRMQNIISRLFYIVFYTKLNIDRRLYFRHWSSNSNFMVDQV